MKIWTPDLLLDVLTPLVFLLFFFMECNILLYELLHHQVHAGRIFWNLTATGEPINTQTLQKGSPKDNMQQVL